MHCLIQSSIANSLYPKSPVHVSTWQLSGHFTQMPLYLDQFKSIRNQIEIVCFIKRLNQTAVSWSKLHIYSFLHKTSLLHFCASTSSKSRLNRNIVFNKWSSVQRSWCSRNICALLINFGYQKVLRFKHLVSFRTS